MPKADDTYANLILPFEVKGNTRLTSPFGVRTHPVTGNQKFHNGIDIGLIMDSPLYAPGDGIVDKSWLSDGPSGNAIIMQHPPFLPNGKGRWRTSFSHLSDRLVKTGDVVAKGELIASSGGCSGCPGAGRSTGPHLHFTTHVWDDLKGRYEAVDPVETLKFQSDLPVDSKLQSELGPEIPKTRMSLKWPLAAVGGVLGSYFLYRRLAK